MENKQEIWTAMILSAYAKKQGISLTETSELLLSNGGLSYLEEFYETLHLLSNEDVVDDLLRIANIQRSAK